MKHSPEAEPTRAPPPPAAKQAPPRCDTGAVVATTTGGRSLVALVRSRAVAFSRPGGAAVRRFGRRNVNHVPTVFAVTTLRRTHACRPSWYRVELPLRPNGATGWVRAQKVRILALDMRIVIHVKSMRLELVRGGRVVLRSPIAPGAPDTPTPLGRFYVTQRLIPKDPNGPWGPAALGTSAFSPVLKSWVQGGPVGIHGTNEPWAIGHAASHGCIRLPNAMMKRLFDQVPAGTPILIRAY